jgi:hypothetical protein
MPAGVTRSATRGSDVEAYSYKGYTLRIQSDPEPESPREWDNIGTMVCWHRRYNLGDEQPKCTPTEYRADLHPDSIILPLYLYDHSGLTISTGPFSCPWDSGQVGFIYVEPNTIMEEYGITEGEVKTHRQQVEGQLRGEVETYDQYLRGDVYGYRVFDPQGECVDSCGGFFGMDYCKDEAIASLVSEGDNAEDRERIAPACD